MDTSQANEECVGPASETAGKASGCEGCPNQKACAEGEGRKEDPEIALIAQRLAGIKRKVRASALGSLDETPAFLSLLPPLSSLLSPLSLALTFSLLSPLLAYLHPPLSLSPQRR